jgi:hypothetical protein
VIGFAVEETADGATETWGRGPKMDLQDSSPADVTADLSLLAAALRELTSHQGVDETLQLIVDLSAELVAGCDICDVMLIGSDGVVTPVASDRLAMQVDNAQQESGEGPCLHAAADGAAVIHVDDLGSDRRWPRFGPRAVELGVRSALSYRVSPAGGRAGWKGALNLYARRSQAFDARSIALGQVFAAQCASVLAAAVEVEGLRTALATRDVIGQAKGILMERHRMDGDAAFALLKRVSQDRNIKLREVARQVVETRQLP